MHRHQRAGAGHSEADVSHRRGRSKIWSRAPFPDYPGVEVVLRVPRWAPTALLVLIVSTLPLGVSWADPGRGNGRDEAPAHGREKEDEDRQEDGQEASERQGSGSPSESRRDPEPSPRPSPTPTSSPKAASDAGATDTVDVSFSASPTSIAVNETSTLEVTLTNRGSTTTGEAEVLVDLPAHLQLVSSEPQASGSDPLRIVLAGLAPGRSASAGLVVVAVDPDGDHRPVRFAVTIDAETSRHELFVSVDEADPSRLSLAQSSPLLIQVGDTAPFSATLSNNTEAPMQDVVVVAEIAPELDVAGVTPIKEADAIQLGASQGREDIVWIFDSLAPGQEVKLTWTARAVVPGDLEAGNVVEATLQGEPAASSRQDTYLGYVRGVRTERPAAPAPLVRERLVTKLVPVSAEVAPSLGGVLPVTGWSPTLLGIGGALLIALGAISLWVSRGPRSRRLALVLLAAVSLTGAACVSDDPSPGSDVGPGAVTSPSPEGSDAEDDEEQEDDEVLGLRIDRSDDDSGTGGPGAGSSQDAESSRDAGTFPEAVPQIVYEEVTEVISIVVPVSELPVESLGARDGDNDLSFSWAPDSNDLQATSSRTLSRDAREEILVALSSEGGRLLATVMVANLADDRRLRVDGRLALEIVAADGRTSALTSDPIHVVLEPGASTTADLAFSLPSGSYAAKGAFLAE